MIYMNNIEYTEIDQTPKMTATDLISNIGGTLGKIIYMLILPIKVTI